MAKVSSIYKNKKRQKLVNKFANKRKKLKEQIYNKEISIEDRFQLVNKLAGITRNSSLTRVRNRCNITGRPRGFYRYFGLSRNMLRMLAGQGALPGVVKSSW